MKDSVGSGADSTSGSAAAVESPYRYGVYGIVILSDAPLELPADTHGALGQVECVSASASAFRAATQGETDDEPSDPWHRYAVLRDGSTYVRWDGIGEFLVGADGRQITCRRLEEASLESFQVYMLGQALSFALVRQGLEPLHATAVVVEGHAVAFLGNNAFGKSTLAACLLEAGHRLLTDDLLVLRESHDRVLAYPGPPRIKLFPKIAGRFLGEAAANRVHMNAGTDKLILPIDEHRQCAQPIALDAIYTLAAPRTACRRPGVSIETLSPREGFVELIKGTFNRRLVSQQRLERQFDFVARLTGLVQVKRLTYPRAIDQLPEVREAVLADCARDVRAAPGVELRFHD